MPKSYRVLLYKALVGSYTLQELAALTFELGIDWSDLTGQNNEEKARSLILHLGSQGRLKELQEILNDIPHNQLIEVLPEGLPEVPDADEQIGDEVNARLSMARDEAFSNYLAQLIEWTHKEQLRQSRPGAEIRDIARTQTLLLLEQLDGAGKRRVVRVLRLLQLIGPEAVISLVGADLQKAQLTDIDLTDADFSGANLVGANMSGSILIGAKFHGADLCDVELAGLQLAKADLSQAILTGVNLSRADLSNACLRGADLREADLSGANLAQADLRGTIIEETKIDEKWRAVWKLVNGDKVMPGMVLTEADLADADLRDVDLTRAQLNKAILTGADLRGAVLVGTDLREADLRNARLMNYSPLDAIIDKLLAWWWEKLRGHQPPYGGARYYGSKQANLFKAMVENADIRGATYSFRQLALVNLGKPGSGPVFTNAQLAAQATLEIPGETEQATELEVSSSDEARPQEADGETLPAEEHKPPARWRW